MAKIALVVEGTTEYSTTRTQKILTDLGHFVDIIQQNLLSVSQGISYDLIITCRISNSSVLSDRIKTLSDNGIPIILGFFNYSLDSNASGSCPLRSLGLSQEVSMVTSNNCFLTEEGARKLNPSVQDFSPYVSPTYMSVIKTTSLSLNAQVFSTTYEGAANLVYFPKGSVNALGNVLSSDIMFAGFIYGNNSEYNYVTTSVISFLISYLLDSRYQIKGRVLNSSSEPTQKTIRVYDQITGRLLNMTASDENGFYEVSLRDQSPVYIICLSDDLTKRNQIIGPLLPIAST